MAFRIEEFPEARVDLVPAFNSNSDYYFPLLSDHRHAQFLLKNTLMAIEPE